MSRQPSTFVTSFPEQPNTVAGLTWCRRNAKKRDSMVIWPAGFPMHKLKVLTEGTQLSIKLSLPMALRRGKNSNTVISHRSNPWLQRLKRFATGKSTMTNVEFSAIRKSCGITQKEMAKILGVSIITIIRAEKTGPSRAVISYLDRALSQGRIKISDKKSSREDSP